MSSEHAIESPSPDALSEQLAHVLGAGETGVGDAVDALLSEAVRRGASDVHLEPHAEALTLRFRIDGALHDAGTLPRDAQARVIARLKVLARLVVYQRDLPQDGRIDGAATSTGKAMRLSTFPTVHGEKAVVRVLDTDPALFNLDALGFRAPVVAALRGFLARPQGTLLLTGPSSSGKTTTIYALLTELIERGGRARHIITLEDPVEYKLPGIAQSEVRLALEFDYQTALRAALRQDPEVIVVGEIRDAETARIAIQAGLTGHLVISTIHSGTAAGVFTRLLDMGVEPYLVASSVSAVLAQRLVRLNCPACAATSPPDAALARAFGLDPADAGHRRGAGCPKCGGIGYHGRTAIGELLGVDETVAAHVLDRGRTAVLERDAREAGMTPLHADGLARVRQGHMPVEELARVLPPPDEGDAA